MVEGMIEPQSLATLIRTPLPEEPTWIGPSILPKNCKMIIGGHAAIGKSFIMLEMVRALALGTVPFDNPKFVVERPTKCLLIEHELKPYGLQKRTQDFFTPEELDLVEDKLYYISGEPSLEFSSDAGRKKITYAVEKFRPEVLFLDPIGKMHYFDENDAASMAKLMHYMDTLLRLGADWGMSLVFSHHFGKPPNDPPVGYDPLESYHFRGSSKFKDDPDTRVTVQRLKRLPVGWESWRMKTRWLTRQGEALPDMYFTFNEHKDLRVRFDRTDEPIITLPDLPPKQRAPEAEDAPPKKTFVEAPERRRKIVEF